MTIEPITLGDKYFIFVVLLSIYFYSGISVVSAQEVVVNPEVTQNEISQNTLRLIFGMRLYKWPDGTPIKVFVLRDDNPVHISFCKKILNLFPHQLRRAWDRLVYSGTGQSPIEVRSEKEMQNKIAAISGAIGYLRRELIDEKIHILSVK